MKRNLLSQIGPIGRVEISEAAHLRRLATDMLLGTLRDLKDPASTLECAVFLLSDEFSFYAELVNMPFADPLKAFQVLSCRQARELLSQIDSMQVGDWDRAQIKAMKSRVAPVLKDIANSKKRFTHIYTSPRGRAARNI